MRETTAATSRTARSVTSSAVPSFIFTVTLKVFLLSLGRNPICTPKADGSPAGPSGLMNCHAGSTHEAAKLAASASISTSSRTG